MTVTFVGEAPGPRTDPGKVFDGACGRRLDALLGRPWREVGPAVNLLGRHPGLTSGGSLFDARGARAAARMLLLCSPRVRHDALLVLCGRRVAGAFGVSVGYFERAVLVRSFNDKWLQWDPAAAAAAGYMWTGMSDGAVNVVVMPHPSSRCRWWNDPANRATARRELRRLTATAKEAA